MNNQKTYYLFFITLLFSIFLFAYKLLSLPPGLETDEGSISYNASLISKDLRDQNGRFMPFFILSSDHLDWKQPVLIYSSAIFFKLFGTSLLNFKLVNVLFSLVTTVLIYFLTRLLIKEKVYALIAMILYSISPMIIITTRIGNESILPAFFSTLWLLLITLYFKKPKKLYLILAALTLGVGFYSFKGMRIIVPVWAVLTTLFILFIHKFSKQSLKNAVLFIITMLPFALIVPLLELKYAGSIFDRSSIPLESYRYYIHYWLANINVFSLFSNPDVGKIYEMKYFGALLISTLPLFLIGVYSQVTGPKYQKFILISYLATPVLFGIAKSTDYSHRLVGIVPLYVIITIFGIKKFYEKLNNHKYSRIILFISLILVALNFIDFVNYYYFVYPNQNQTKLAFANNYHTAFKSLSDLSKAKNLKPYIQSDIYDSHGDANKFFEQAYFKKSINIWHLGDPMPQNSILLTQVAKLESATNLQVDLRQPNINLLISNEN